MYLLDKPLSKVRLSGAKHPQWPDSDDWPFMDSNSKRERGENGWCDSDTWSFDRYLAGVIAAGVRHIGEFEGYKGESADEWGKTLDAIATGFEAYNAPGAFHDEAAWKACSKSLKLLRKSFPVLWT